MIDGSAWEIPKRDPDSDASAHAHISDVSPSSKARASFIFTHYLKLVGMDMERMIEIHHHPPSVNNFPFLYGSDFDNGVGPFRVER